MIISLVKAMQSTKEPKTDEKLDGNNSVGEEIWEFIWSEWKFNQPRS